MGNIESGLGGPCSPGERDLQGQETVQLPRHKLHQPAPDPPSAEVNASGGPSATPRQHAAQPNALRSSAMDAPTLSMEQERLPPFVGAGHDSNINNNPKNGMIATSSTVDHRSAAAQPAASMVAGMTESASPALSYAQFNQTKSRHGFEVSGTETRRAVTEGEEEFIAGTPLATSAFSENNSRQNYNNTHDNVTDYDGANNSSTAVIAPPVPQFLDDQDSVMSLMEASAAVFAILQQAATANDDTIDYTDDGSSIVDNREVVAVDVMRDLRDQCDQGNESAAIGFFETASAVSQVILQQYSDSNHNNSGTPHSAGHGGSVRDDHDALPFAKSFLLDDNRSVSNASQAVFQLLQAAQTGIDLDDATITDASAMVFKMLDGTASSQYYDGTDDSIALDARSATFDGNQSVMNGGMSIMTNVSQKSVALWKILDTCQSQASEAEAVHAFGQTIKNLLFLQEQQIRMNQRDSTEPSGNTTGLAKEVFDHYYHALQLNAKSPKTDVGVNMDAYPTPTNRDRKDHSSFVSPASRTTIRAAGGAAAAAAAPKGASSGQRFNFVGQNLSNLDEHEESDQEEIDALRESESMENAKRELEEDDDIDMRFVELYDNAFNEFIGQNPHFLVENPDLVHNIRVAKLQKLFEHNEIVLYTLEEQLKQAKLDKEESQLKLATELREASRRKAAREITLQRDLHQAQTKAKMKQARLVWSLVDMAERRAKKHHSAQQELKTKMSSGITETLLECIPKDLPDSSSSSFKQSNSTSSRSLMDTILAQPIQGQELTAEQEQVLRQAQVDNAFLNAEVNIVKRKLGAVQAAAEKNAWIESMLLKMTPEVLAKLRLKYSEESGVDF